MMKSMWRIKIKSKDKKKLVRFAFDEHLDISCGGPTLQDDGTFGIDAYVEEGKKNTLFNKKSNLIDMEILEDMSKVGIQRQKQVSKVNRFEEKRSHIVEGFGVKE
jgi:hypothetical protein